MNLDHFERMADSRFWQAVDRVATWSLIVSGVVIIVLWSGL